MQTLRLKEGIDCWSIPSREISMDALLGRGNFGEVHKGQLRGCETVAVKTLKSKKDASGSVIARDKESFRIEQEFMKKLNHPNLVKMFGISVDDIPFKIIMEYCHTGALKDHVMKFRKTGSENKLDRKFYDSKHHDYNGDVPKFPQLREWCEQIASGMSQKY